jgi:hypothetical protein
MDTLALGALVIGLLAAIGVVVLAVREKETGAAQPENGKQTSPPPPQQAVAAPAGPAATQPAPDHVMTAPQEEHPLAPLAMQGADPLLQGLGKQVQILTNDLQKLRQQEEATERRLKLINGIAVLLQEIEGSSLNGGNKTSSSLGASSQAK